MAYDSARNALWIANYGLDTISEIDTTTGSFQSVNVGLYPEAVAPTAKYAFSANRIGTAPESPFAELC
jgi:DNA-binding beta-propeller fold protein YncE